MSNDPRKKETLNECVRRAPKADFFALVALIEQLTPEAGKVGSDAFPHREAIRFRHSADLSFSAGDVAEAHIEPNPARDQGSVDVDDSTESIVALTTTFLGLTGSVSPLPLYMAELALAERDESAVGEFLDLFHHRALSLLYRWVIRHRIEAGLSSRADDVWSKRLLALGGVDAYASEADAVRPMRSLYLQLLPPLASRTRSASALERSLEHVLEQALEPSDEDAEPVAVRVHQWVGDPLPIDTRQQVRLGAAETVLGSTARLGRRQFDRSARFVVRIGPLRAAAYRRCVPGGDLDPSIRETIALFCPLGVRYQVALVLSEHDAPAFAASLRGDPLGRSTWLRGGSKPKVTISAPQEPTHAH
jgi:type VI secretion system protein ImpH